MDLHIRDVNSRARHLRMEMVSSSQITSAYVHIHDAVGMLLLSFLFPGNFSRPCARLVPFRNNSSNYSDICASTKEGLTFPIQSHTFIPMPEEKDKSSTMQNAREHHAADPNKEPRQNRLGRYRVDYLPDRSRVLCLRSFSLASSYTKNSCRALPPGTMGNTGTF